MLKKIIEPDHEPFDEPVKIKCIVNGKKLLAEVLGQIDDPIQCCLVIQMSDGVRFEAIASEVEDDWIVINRKFLPYLQAIQKELDSFVSVMHGDWYKFEINHDGKNILVWVSDKSGDEYPYVVHFDGHYQMHLKECYPKWEAMSMSKVDDAPINEGILQKVAGELQKRIYL